jgi:hypothetical protein
MTPFSQRKTLLPSAVLLMPTTIPPSALTARASLEKSPPGSSPRPMNIASANAGDVGPSVTKAEIRKNARKTAS